MADEQNTTTRTKQHCSEDNGNSYRLQVDEQSLHCIVVVLMYLRGMGRLLV